MKTRRSKLLLIYTGGTIGMWKDNQSKSLKVFDFDQLLSKIPEINLLEHTIDTLSFEKPIDSSDFGIPQYQKLAKIIYDKYNFYDGFVVLHGSDTMSYTASILSFMLQNLSKPIIFTGSQLPIGDLRTDAKENLISSLQIAGLKQEDSPVIQEVGLYFEYKLYRANRTTKVNAEHFEAFDSPNYPPLIQSGVNLKINKAATISVKAEKEIIIYPQLDDNIILLKLFPALNKNIFENILKITSTKGIIIETFGSGNFKTDSWFLDTLQSKIEQSIPVVNITQCIGGEVHMGKYQTSEYLLQMGVVSGKDMTTEAAITKMMHLLPKKLSIKRFKEEFETPISGEISME